MGEKEQNSGYCIFKRSCITCSHKNDKICTGYGDRTDNLGYTYMMPIEEAVDMFPEGCGDWGFSIDSIMED